VIDQVLVEEEYLPLSRVTAPRLIIDCGANIGCTAVYLLTRFPGAQLIAVEPDAGNFAMCSRNLTGFGTRARVVQAGIWHRDATLRVQRGGFRDGREWSFQVRECAPGESGEVPAVTISSLLRGSGHERIDILKVDIEGAERWVFANNCDDWLDRTACLAIEIHDPAARQIVLEAIGRHAFELTTVNQTLFCFRYRP
jgi:FkbM family methyltransferase